MRVRTAFLATTAIAAPILLLGLPAVGAATGTTQVVGSVPGVDNFQGIVRISGCSASLVRFKQSQDSDQAMMMTNAHCTGPLPPQGTAYINKPSSKTGTLLVGNVQVKAQMLVYATDTHTDTAFYRLTDTYAALRQRGAHILTMADHAPSVGTKVTVSSGGWNKRFKCVLDKQVFQLKEASSIWKEAVRYAPDSSATASGKEVDVTCTTGPGTSGSPVIDNATGEVVAINNTGVEGTGSPCSESNPCEIDEAGQTSMPKGARYGTQTWWFTQCLNDRREVDPNVPTCTMPKMAAP